MPILQNLIGHNPILQLETVKLLGMQRKEGISTRLLACVRAFLDPTF